MRIAHRELIENVQIVQFDARRLHDDGRIQLGELCQRDSGTILANMRLANVKLGTDVKEVGARRGVQHETLDAGQRDVLRCTHTHARAHARVGASAKRRRRAHAYAARAD